MRSHQSTKAFSYAAVIGWALWLLGAHEALAQHKPVPIDRLPLVRDSVERLLVRYPRRDTVRVNRLNWLAFVLRTNYPFQTRMLGQQAMQLAQQLHYRQGLLIAYFNLGYYYRGSRQYDSALYFTRYTLALTTRPAERYDRTRALYNLTRIYFEQGNYVQALTTSLDGLALARAIPNTKSELFQLMLAGRIETELGEYSKAQRHLDEALRLVPTVRDAIGEGQVYGSLGDLNRRQQRWSLADLYYRQAAACYRRVYNVNGLLPAELDIAEIAERQGRYELARQSSATMLRRVRNAHILGQLGRIELLLARCWLAQGNADSAAYYGHLSLAETRHTGQRAAAREAAAVLAQTSSRLGRGADAYRYQLMASAYADSLMDESGSRRVAALEAEAARSQQQTQISLLRQQARLHAQQHELERLRSRQLISGLVALAALLLTVGVGILWRYRRREAKSLLALRTRIAADLHDEVGSMLTQISMQSTVLRETRDTPAQQQAYLDQIADASRRAARQLSDAVWSIDARHDSAESLLNRLRDHAHEVLPAARIELLFSVDPAVVAGAMPLPTRQALYFIYKEALHNVVKHAQAQHVWVRLRQISGQLELEVRDDGQGMPQPPRAGGQGLRNMQMRAAALGGTVRVAPSRPGPGLVVTARLP